MTSPETLSREEVEALLSAVRSGAVPTAPAPGPRGPAEPVPYNFRRPSRASKEQLRGLALLHEDFAKLISGSLSGLLRAMVDVEVEAVEQVAYAEYVLAMATPTCAFVFKMEPLKGGAVLEVTPNVAFVMMDRMLGGPGQVLGPPRDLTEIERAVMDRIGLRAMDDLRQAWQQVGAFTPRILNLETNPLLIQVTSQNEVLLVANLRVKIGDTLGAVTLAYPYLLLEPVLDRLGLRRWAQIAATAPSPDSRAFVVRELSRSPLTLRAFLGRTTLRVRDLLSLTPGQVLRLEPAGTAPVRLHLNDVPKFTGRLGTRRTHLAVEVTGRLDEESPRL